MPDSNLDLDAQNDDDLTDVSAVGSMDSSQTQTLSATHNVQKVEAGERIDKLATIVFDGHSRSELQGWITSGDLTVNGQTVKPKYRVSVGDELALSVTLTPHREDMPENIPLDVMFEDEAVLVINKPVGMVVHPGAGNWTGTLVNALLYHYPEQAHLPRAGLVHRIDKDTSGLLIIGKTKTAQLDLQDQLKDKTVYRHYKCVVAGDKDSLMRQRTIDAPIGRHRTHRTKMAVTGATGNKPAVTHIVDVTDIHPAYSLLDIELETGRTHQIRVHLSHIGHPIIGDAVYGNRSQLRAGLTDEQRHTIQTFPRQALHAYALGFEHPITGEDIEVTAPMPDDMQGLIDVLAQDAS